MVVILTLPKILYDTKAHLISSIHRCDNAWCWNKGRIISERVGWHLLSFLSDKLEPICLFVRLKTKSLMLHYYYTWWQKEIHNGFQVNCTRNAAGKKKKKNLTWKKPHINPQLAVNQSCSRSWKIYSGMLMTTRHTHTWYTQCSWNCQVEPAAT